MALFILVLASRPHARRSTLIAQSRVAATTHAPPDIEHLERLAAGGGVEGFSARSRLEEWKFESMEPALPEKIPLLPALFADPAISFLKISPPQGWPAWGALGSP